MKTKKYHKIAPTAFCPRCDKEFISPLSRADAMAMMKEHVKTAHPAYYAEHIRDD